MPVIKFQTEEEAIDLANDTDYGLGARVISSDIPTVEDILMPEMDGVAAARHIKEKGIDAHIIFLTNLGDEKNISKAMEAVNNMEYILKTDMRVADIIRRVREKLGLS